MAGALIMFVSILAACGTGGNQGNRLAENQNKEPEEQLTIKSDTANATTSAAVLALADDTHDFGEIAEGQKVEHEFKFKNDGTSPLIISNVQASCGCTTPNYTNRPVAPGEEGVVRVVFNSEGQLGKQHKVITVTSNASNANTLLHLRGEVKK